MYLLIILNADIFFIIILIILIGEKLYFADSGVLAVDGDQGITSTIVNIVGTEPSIELTNLQSRGAQIYHTKKDSTIIFSQPYGLWFLSADKDEDPYSIYYNPFTRPEFIDQITKSNLNTINGFIAKHCKLTKLNDPNCACINKQGADESDLSNQFCMLNLFHDDPKLLKVIKNNSATAYGKLLNSCHCYNGKCTKYSPYMLKLLTLTECPTSALTICNMNIAAKGNISASKSNIQNKCGGSSVNTSTGGSGSKNDDDKKKGKNDDDKKKGKKKGKSTVLIIIIVVILVLLLGGIGFYFLNSE